MVVITKRYKVESPTTILNFRYYDIFLSSQGKCRYNRPTVISLFGSSIYRQTVYFGYCMVQYPRHSKFTILYWIYRYQDISLFSSIYLWLGVGGVVAQWWRWTAGQEINRSCTWGMFPTIIHLISINYPRPTIALQSSFVS